VNINLNGRVFRPINSALLTQCDGTYEKQLDGVLLRNESDKVIAFLVNGHRHRESPFLVTARYQEATKRVHYQLALSSIDDKFFNTVLEGEFYPHRPLKNKLDEDVILAVR
jgi:hypothetical protein